LRQKWCRAAKKRGRCQLYDQRGDPGDRTDLCAATVNDDCRINAGTGHLCELSVLIDVNLVKVELAIYFGEFGECREDRLRSKSVVLNGLGPIELWHSPELVPTSLHDSRQHIRCLGKSKKNVGS
jgi:hypothetical protein